MSGICKLSIRVSFKFLVKVSALSVSRDLQRLVNDGLSPTRKARETATPQSHRSSSLAKHGHEAARNS